MELPQWLIDEHLNLISEQELSRQRCEQLIADCESAVKKEQTRISKLLTTHIQNKHKWVQEMRNAGKL
jgi:hypothetical protein